MTPDEVEDDRPFPKHGSPEWEEMMAPHRAWIAQMDEDRAAEQAAARAEKEAAEKALTPDVVRHTSSVRLLGQLDVMNDLAGHCQRLTNNRSLEGVEPVLAAAQLMRAGAQLGQALAKLTSTESRQRRIIERVQPPAPQMPDSNATLDASVTNASQDIAKQAGAALDGLLFDTLQRKMLLYMNLVATQSFDKDLKEAYPELYEAAAAPAANGV